MFKLQVQTLLGVQGHYTQILPSALTSLAGPLGIPASHEHATLILQGAVSHSLPEVL